MIKKTILALSVATIATSGVALPAAVAGQAADTSVQVAAALSACALAGGCASWAAELMACWNRTPPGSC